MKNYINIRVQVAKKLSIRHNISSKQDRTLSTQKDNVNNLYYDFESGKITEINEKNERYLQSKHTKQYNTNNDIFLTNYYNRTKRKSKAINRGNLEGIITFSEAIDNDLDTKYSKKELFELALQTIKDIAKKWDSHINYLVLHLDEKRPHFHFSLNNFDSSRDGYSLTYKHRFSKDLSILQDISFNNFKKINMQRGLKKGTTKANHQSIKKYYEKELNNAKHSINELDSLTRLIFSGFTMLEESKNIEELKETRQTIKEYKAKHKDSLSKEQITTLNFLMRSCTEKMQNKKIKSLQSKKQEFYEALQERTIIELENQANIFNTINFDKAKEVIEEAIATLKKKNELELLKIDKKRKEIEIIKQDIDEKNEHITTLNKSNEHKLQEIQNNPTNKLIVELQEKENHISSLNLQNNKLNQQLVEYHYKLQDLELQKNKKIEEIIKLKNKEIKEIIEKYTPKTSPLMEQINEQAHKIKTLIESYNDKKARQASNVIQRLNTHSSKKEKQIEIITR